MVGCFRLFTPRGLDYCRLTSRSTRSESGFSVTVSLEVRGSLETMGEMLRMSLGYSLTLPKRVIRCDVVPSRHVRPSRTRRDTLGSGRNERLVVDVLVGS